MPQLEGQPGSRGMNPPGGISTINLSNWSDPSPPSRRNNQPNDGRISQSFDGRNYQSNDGRNYQPNGDSLSQSGNDNTGSRPSAGLCNDNNSRGIARMHQAPGGNSAIYFGSQNSAAEAEALLKKRPGYDEKRKEMYGSGIFNETSGSSDGDSGYGGFADKAPAAGENQQPRHRIQSDAKHKELFGSKPIDFQEPKYRPASDAKARELNGSNIFGYNSNHDYHPPSRGSYQESEDHRFTPRQSSNNSPRGANQGSYGGDDSYGGDGPASNYSDGAKQSEDLNDLTGRLSLSNAKAREMAGDNIFGPSPLDAAKMAAHNREPAGKRSQLMLNNQDRDEYPDPYGQRKHEMKSAELSGNNIFHGGSNSGDETPQYQQRSVAKVREMSGSDIFSNDQPKQRNTVGGIRKPPGGGSTIMLA